MARTTDPVCKKTGDHDRHETEQSTDDLDEQEFPGALATEKCHPAQREDRHKVEHREACKRGKGVRIDDLDAESHTQRRRTKRSR